jgi:S-disulfanyl-L-cysteine oxidoreductase SoxD
VKQVASVVSLLLAMGGCAAGGGAASQGPSHGSGVGVATPPRTVAWYTDAQADRGQRVFDTVCATCHATREFTGRMFELTWKAEPVANLFQHIRAAMPQDDPGSLSAEEYASVVAYLLRLNGVAPGAEELPADPGVLGAVGWTVGTR